MGRSVSGFLGACAVLSGSFLSGCKTRDWASILQENRGRVDFPFLARAAAITLETVATSLLATVEPDPKLTAPQQAYWDQTIFVLGLPRSGTTLLQNWLAANPDLAYPTRLDCFNPHTFITLHRLGLNWLLAQIPARKRALDNVKMGWSSPDEDEFALTVLAADGPWLGVVFGERRNHYREQCPLNPHWQGATRWKAALELLTRKLVALHNKPLVLKSPLHTMRIPDILEVFPQARFVTIFRNPQEQSRSTVGVAKQKTIWPALQTYRPEEHEYFDYNQRIFQRYFETRQLIPQENLVEVTYEDLVASPADTLRQIHEKLNLPGLNPLLTKVAADPTHRAYQKNQHQELTAAEQERAMELYAPLRQAGFYQECPA